MLHGVLPESIGMKRRRVVWRGAAEIVQKLSARGHNLTAQRA